MKVHTGSCVVDRTLRNPISFLLMENYVGLILDAFALTQLLGLKISLAHVINIRLPRFECVNYNNLITPIIIVLNHTCHVVGHQSHLPHLALLRQCQGSSVGAFAFPQSLYSRFTDLHPT